MDDGAGSGRVSLTERQRRVLTLVAMGCTAEEIGRELGISARTARAHRDALRVKLGVRRCRDLALAYRRATGLDAITGTPLETGEGDAVSRAGPPPHEAAAGRRTGHATVVPTPNLTDREREILLLVGRGLADKEIAVELSIALHTVKNHMAAIRQKIGARNRIEAVVAAGLLTPATYDAPSVGRSASPTTSPAAL